MQFSEGEKNAEGRKEVLLSIFLSCHILLNRTGLEILLKSHQAPEKQKPKLIFPIPVHPSGFNTFGGCHQLLSSLSGCVCVCVYSFVFVFIIPNFAWPLVHSNRNAYMGINHPGCLTVLSQSFASQKKIAYFLDDCSKYIIFYLFYWNWSD